MSIGANWAEIWKPVWKAVWTQSPAVTPVADAHGGAGKSKRYRRRWQAEKDGKVFEFNNAREAQQFLQSVVEEPKKKSRKKTFRLPDVKLFYNDREVTKLVVDDKPVIQWFFGEPSLKALERALEEMDEDDIEVLIFGL